VARFRTRGKGPTRKVYPLHGRGRSRLNYAERQRLPPSAFAIPEREAYPVPTVEQLREAGVPNPEKAGETHARNALARVAANGTESEKHRVCRLVATRYPEVHESNCLMHERKKPGSPSFQLTKVASSDRGAEAFPKGEPKVHQLFGQPTRGGASREIFRTFDDAGARNAQEALRKAKIPFTVTRSTEGSANQFKMIEFHTSPKHRNQAFRIIDEEVNSR
jgi:hypothetical protein